jgi:hypothetical protein
MPGAPHPLLSGAIGMALAGTLFVSGADTLWLPIAGLLETASDLGFGNRPRLRA